MSDCFLSNKQCQSLAVCSVISASSMLPFDALAQFPKPLGQCNYICTHDRLRNESRKTTLSGSQRIGTPPMPVALDLIHHARAHSSLRCQNPSEVISGARPTATPSGFKKDRFQLATIGPLLYGDNRPEDTDSEYNLNFSQLLQSRGTRRFCQIRKCLQSCLWPEMKRKELHFGRQ